MSIIRPFKAVRPQARMVKEVASYPYDVLEEDEARLLGEQNPRSFLHVERSEIDFPSGVRPTDERVVSAARANLQRWIGEGIFVQDENPCLYVYGLKMGDHTQYGIVGGLSVREYDSGAIKKHESIRREREEERTLHVDAVNANTGLVFLFYPARKAIDRLVESIVSSVPEYDFVFDNGVRHTVWVVHEQQGIDAIRSEFQRVNSVYIADGHHRAAAAAAVARIRNSTLPDPREEKEYEFFMGALFPHEQVRLFAYNRVIKALPRFTDEEFLERIRQDFDVSPDFRDKCPSSAHEFGMYLDGRWYLLRLKGDRRKNRELIEKTGSWLLQKYALGPVLGIEDPRKDKRIWFIDGPRGTAELEKRVDSGEFTVAFTVHPPAVEELMEIADAGQVMPPKSTWFEPKLLSGIFVHFLSGC
jgi:uncharacterized protein (DUF1015 family)